MLLFDKATYLSLLLKFILSERLSDSLWGWNVLPAFTCTSAIGSICLWLNILRFAWSKTSATQPRAGRVDILGSPFPWIVLYLTSDTNEE